MGRSESIQHQVRPGCRGCTHACPPVLSSVINIYMEKDSRTDAWLPGLYSPVLPNSLEEA